MTFPAFGLCAICGTLPLLFLPALPPVSYAFAAALPALLLAGLPGKIRYAGVILLCVCWAVGNAQHTLNQAMSLAGHSQRVRVVINATDGEKHDVQIIAAAGRWLPGGVGATLYGKSLPATVCSGQRWDMQLALRPVHGQLNDGGFDSQRYAVSQGKLLSGRIISALPVDSRCGLRGRYITSVKNALAHLPWRDVILALGFGERLTVSREIKMLMRDTGTAHLMAISGLHIALAGSLGWGIARLIQRLLPAAFIGFRLYLLMSLIAAAVYTWLAGSNPPALRTLVSLVIWAVIRLSARNGQAWQVWLCCVGGILLFDPLAVLSESLWLSAFAVASLIFWYQWLPLNVTPGHRGVRLLYGMIHLQAGITLLLLPLQVFVFHGVSATSLLANLFAVPAVTFVSVPLILVGMLLNLTPFAATEQGIWWLADRSLAGLFYALKALPTGWIEVDERFRWLALLPWGVTIAWRLRLAAVLPGTILAVVVTCAWPLYYREDESRWGVHMLDIGHGLAMVVERRGKAILYDTGNAWPGGDSAQRTIIPWLRWHRLWPDGIVISHEHLDHRGGLLSLQQAWPEVWVRSSLGEAGHLPCERGQTWRWQGLTFTVHWPLPGHTLRGNNRSCVVKVDDGHHSILLTGDIEADAEMAMLRQYWQHLGADVIQVPHHGSKTSSTPVLLRRAAGKVALASVARYNAWHLPAARVQERYRRQGYIWYDTAHAGQISVEFTASGWRLLRYREQILPRWYHQWFGVPADSR